MKKYLIIAAIALAVAAVVTIWVQRSRINQLTGERDKYRTNTETLLQDVSRYQTKDSLNAAKVGVLELKLSEFEKYRASDAELIKTLQTKNRELEAVTTAQMETITKVRGTVRGKLLFRFFAKNGCDCIRFRLSYACITFPPGAASGVPVNAKQNGVVAAICMDNVCTSATFR